MVGAGVGTTVSSSSAAMVGGGVGDGVSAPMAGVGVGVKVSPSSAAMVGGGVRDRVGAGVAVAVAVANKRPVFPSVLHIKKRGRKTRAGRREGDVRTGAKNRFAINAPHERRTVHNHGRPLIATRCNQSKTTTGLWAQKTSAYTRSQLLQTKDGSVHSHTARCRVRQHSQNDHPNRSSSVAITREPTTTHLRRGSRRRSRSLPGYPRT